MNCKPGDMALVKFGPSAGLMVTVLQRFDPRFSVPTSDGPYRVRNRDVIVWSIDKAIEWYAHGAPPNKLIRATVALDCQLMPLHPERDEDLEEVQKTSDLMAIAKHKWNVIDTAVRTK